MHSPKLKLIQVHYEARAFDLGVGKIQYYLPLMAQKSCIPKLCGLIWLILEHSYTYFSLYGLLLFFWLLIQCLLNVCDLPDILPIVPHLILTIL